MNHRPNRLIAFVAILSLAALGLAACGGGGGAKGGWSFAGSSYWTDVNDVKVSGNLAFLTMTNGILVIDITDVLNPVEVTRVYLQGGDGLVLKDSILFVACHTLGIAAVDVADPVNPRFIGRVTDGLTYATSLALKGNTLLVGDDGLGLVTVDISNPTAMRVLGRATPAAPDRIYNIRVEGDRAYAGAGRAGVLVANVSDVANPTIVSLTPVAGEGSVQDVMPAGNILLASVQVGRLVSLDATDPASPTIVSTVATGRVSKGLSSKGTTLYVFGGTGMTLFDVSNPAAPQLVSRADPGGNASRGLFVGSMLHVASGPSGYQIFDTADMSAPPVLRAWFRTNNYLRAVASDAGYLYISGWTDGIFVDTVTASGSVPFSSVSVPGRAFKLEAVGKRLFAFLEGGTVLVYDKTAPSNLAVSGRYLASNNVVSGTVQGDRMLLGTDAEAIEVVDIQNPDTPVYLYRVFVDDRSVGAYLKGTNLIAADSSGGFLVFDVRDPASPIEVAHVEGASGTVGIALDGNLLWVGTTGEGINLYDVSNPAMPVQVGSVGVEVVGTLQSMRLFEGVLVVGSEENGLMVFTPEGKGAKLEYQYRTPNRPTSFALAGSALFVADVSSVLTFVWK